MTVIAKVRHTTDQEGENQKLLDEKNGSFSETGEKRDSDLMYQRLITESRFVPGGSWDGKLERLSDIPWVDWSLIQQGKKFHRDYFSAILLSDAAALMYGFAFKSNSAILLRTGKLSSSELSFKRFISTVQRFKAAFQKQLDSEEFYKTFAIVRKMHALASKKGPELNPTPDELKLSEPWKKTMAEAMRKDLEFLDTSEVPSFILTWDVPIPVSQLDMMITSLGFVGVLAMFGSVFGIPEPEMNHMKGYIHLWAIFSRLLGIRDEYNICIKPDLEVFRKLFYNLVLASLKNSDETVITIQSIFADAFSSRTGFTTYKAMMYTGLLSVEGYKGENLWQIMNFRDKISSYAIFAMFWAFRNVPLFRQLFNYFTIFWIFINDS